MNEQNKIDDWTINLILSVEQKASDINSLYKKVVQAKKNEIKAGVSVKEAEELFKAKKLCKCEMLKHYIKHNDAKVALIRALNSDFIAEEELINFQLNLMAKRTIRLMNLQNRYIKRLLKLNIINKRKALK